MAWENANTYAPWVTPSEQGGNPSFAGYGEGKGNTYNPAAMAGTAHLFGAIPTLFGASQGLFGTAKKRSSPNFYAPSYQGQMFTPQEGVPDWYTNTDMSDDWMGMSGLGQSYTASLNAPQTQQQPQQTPQSSQGASGMGSGFDMAYMPNYVGQSVGYGGYGNYQPDYAQTSGLSPTSLGGYNSYGGYGASNSSAKSSSYQPFVPTGYGQY